ncbi:MAG: GntR family transcriptional regulator [Roseburia sp.]|nr:GntR family transcriptional regulator [Roseburia sp.]MCM1098727.1 GntR family transcriptional regulator [Ruminococcus flavefaciens]
MRFQKIDAPSIKELFLSQIEEMILSGELKPNDRLPTERELAETMGISKTIVHDGIRELARMGFLDVVSRQGIYVADYTSTGNIDTLFAIIRFRGGMPDKKMLVSLLDIRLGLECPAIREIALRRDPEDIRTLEALQENMRKSLAADAETFATTLFLYRKTLAALSGNVISPLIMNAFFTASVPAWIDYCEYTGRQNTYRALVQTTWYIRNGDADSAVRLFTECIGRYRDHLLRDS